MVVKLMTPPFPVYQGSALHLKVDLSNQKGVGTFPSLFPGTLLLLHTSLVYHIQSRSWSLKPRTFLLLSVL